MKKVYAVAKSRTLLEAAFVCESKDDAIEMAKQVNYFAEDTDADEGAEQYVYESPYSRAD